MTEKKIIDLNQFRKQKNPKAETSSGLSSPNKTRSFEEKLQDFIHRPFNEPGSKSELIAIFEEEQVKKDAENEDE